MNTSPSSLTRGVESVPAALLCREIEALGVTHVITVPDTHQKTLLAALENVPSLTVLTVSTEDEAIGINAGLWIGGARPLLIVQNVGVFASMNSLQGIAIGMKVPTCMLVGQFGRRPDVPVEESSVLAVRKTEALLAALDVPCYQMDGPDDAGVLTTAFEHSRQARGPAVVLVNAPTA